jgi:hypothetical protein
MTQVIKVPITAIINQSITTGAVPQSMKYARVKPLFKKNSPLEVGNYRPISILSIVSRYIYIYIYIYTQDMCLWNTFV